MSTSRQPLPPSTHAAPISPSNNHRPNYADFRHSPPIPPRSSSYRSHHGSNATSAASSSDKVSGSRHARSKGDRNASRRERPADDMNGASRSRREDPPKGARSSTRHPPSAANSRQGTLMETIPGQGALVKESSTVINQVVVSDPSVDIEREIVRQSGAPAPSPTTKAPASGLALVGEDGVDDGARGGMRNHDHNANSSRRKETTFGQFVLGQTLGEGEFGKVKLGWKKDGTIQVAIKLIRREILGSNPSRLPKIYREISILRDLSHPNIVRLHEMVETDRHIGIIMEYASGGELFDHILSNRYLKDNSARRLFAQLVSGVGYLHKKGIVHRDLKLENLLLDRNRNIIITDFGFANTFDPADELEEEIEYNLTNKEYVKRMRLDKTNSAGLRRGDLMQTSCGSPCYAAPELVVSDSLYTGRKVDVWSCGVILYAMLAGYLPFDDDPANPDGDNINLLYKYIVTTPLTFPEYVTPHARDLLRRILVPDPRKRADLFEVARHSWLSEYSHVVSHITSSTTKVSDIASATIPLEQKEGPSLARSASVREPPKVYHNAVPAVGGLNHQSGDISQEQPAEKAKTPRDAKRRTVQVEYVAPQSQTTRGETPDMGGVQESDTMAAPPVSRNVPESGYRTRESQPAPVGHAPLPTTGKPARSNSDATAFPAPQPAAPQSARPTTGGSMGSFNTGRLPSRGSYGQPVAPTVAATNAEGRLAQPKSNQYVISGPMPQDQPQPDMDIGRPSVQQLPSKFNTTPHQPPKGHKRSNTVSGIGEKLFGRSGSIFGGRTAQPSARPRPGKRYPPTSMREPVGDEARMSMDSRRSAQYGSNRNEGAENRPRRFSLLPPSFSLKNFSSSSRSQTPDEETQAARAMETRSHQRPSTGISRPRPRATTYGTPDNMAMVSEGPSEEPIVHEEPANYQPHDNQYSMQPNYQTTPYSSASAEQVYSNDQSHYARHPQANQSAPNYYGEYESHESSARPSMQVSRAGRPGVLQKNRKFADAYEYERDVPYQAGSSGAARKVMDFFRRRAKSRAGDER